MEEVDEEHQTDDQEEKQTTCMSQSRYVLLLPRKGLRYDTAFYMYRLLRFADETSSTPTGFPMGTYLLDQLVL